MLLSLVRGVVMQSGLEGENEIVEQKESTEVERSAVN
jgi:hypothetical protein